MNKGVNEVKRKTQKSIFIFIMVGSILVYFQNCGPGFEVVSDKILERIDGLPISGIFDKACESGEYDACLYFKNPMAHSELSQESNAEEGVASLSKTNSSPSNTYAVNFFGLFDPSVLMSEDLVIMTDLNTVARSPAGHWRFYNIEQSPEYLAYAMSYYWGSEYLNFLKESGAGYIGGRAIKIYPDSIITGWSHNTGSLFLTSDVAFGKETAFDSGVLVHLLTEAAIGYATDGEVYELAPDDTNHVHCGPEEGPLRAFNCCASSNGCSRAITAGLSDYMVGVMFPTHPSFGDYVFKNKNGAPVCTAQRSLASVNWYPSANQAYNSCSEFESGHVYAMGKLFAEIWWGVRIHLDRKSVV